MLISYRVAKDTQEDIDMTAVLMQKLWPGDDYTEMLDCADTYIRGEESAVFLAFADTECVGMAACTLRHDYVEGCDSSPVGYLEGIFVEEAYRHNMVAQKLLGECEAWAKTKGCREFASDCELTNTASLAFHLNVGFSEAGRIICFKKVL